MPFRIALALNLATEAAVRTFCVGAHKFAHEHQDWVIQRSNSSTILSWEQALKMDVDGILGIFEPWSPMDPEQVGRAKVVILNAAVKSHPYHVVTSDDVEAGRRAAEHLLERRLTNFAYVSIPGVYFSTRRRLGFEQVLHAAGFKDPLPEISTDTLKYQEAEFREWLYALPQPCGVLCANDGIAFEMVTATRRAGLHVPNDIAVIGISNDELGCVESEVTLTSVHENFAEVGYRAAAQLHALLNGRPVPNTTVLIPPGRVIERESTRMFSVADPLVRRALLLIDQEIQKVTVDSLLISLGNPSRRILEMRFRKALGRSPYKEILHVRIRRARHLMRHTHLPVGEVALKCGFYDTPQFCRHFKRISGHTPSKYRALVTATAR